MKSLGIGGLLARYRAGELKPSELIEDILPSVAADDRHTWITRLERERVLSYARALERMSSDLPLYGIPFAIKDNIDLSGVATTAGCPAFSYTASQSAAVVDKLIHAGAIPLGKTNLDQFAAGLSGTRSPYGVCRNSFDPAFIAGGSSSGSAVAVATGQVSFALGTDTAGSGRVPAAFNNILGLKPSCGRLSTRGVVPACRSLDCVSIFALTSEDAARVLAVTEGYDAEDPYSRRFSSASLRTAAARVGFVFGVPASSDLEFFGDALQERAWQQAVALLEEMGGRRVEIDFAPFFETARLLYDGPWLAERYAALSEFIDLHADAMHPVTRDIIVRGKTPLAVDAFRAEYRRMSLKRAADAAWSGIDFMVTPTAPTIYSIDAMLADPVRLNSTLGRYTNFMNLLDFSAVAVPTGFRDDGLPFGVTLFGHSGADAELLGWADRVHRASGVPLGATQGKQPPSIPVVANPSSDHLSIAVCGAHMRGLPLNRELTDRGATLQVRTTTAPHYRLYALPGGKVARPGLVRVQQGGAAIEVEVWSMPIESFGSFLKNVPAPLGVGRIELAGGDSVAGCICETYAIADARDVTQYGGWRAYLAGT